MHRSDTLKESRADCVAVKATLKEAITIRMKEVSSFAAEKSDTVADIAVMGAKMHRFGPTGSRCESPPKTFAAEEHCSLSELIQFC